MDLNLTALNINIQHVGWTIAYGIGTALFAFATYRSHGRLHTAEEKLLPESVLHIARLVFHLCLGLAILGFLHTSVGILAIFRVPEISTDILLIGSGIFCVLGFMEVGTVNAMLVAIKREARDGLWQQIGIPEDFPGGA